MSNLSKLTKLVPPSAAAKEVACRERNFRRAIGNARAFMQVQAEFGSFDAYLWAFVDGKPVAEDCSEHTTSPLGDRVSTDLKQRGFKFVGPVISYSFLQASGIICGHERGCDLCALT